MTKKVVIGVEHDRQYYVNQGDYGHEDAVIIKALTTRKDTRNPRDQASGVRR